ncbi:hypothetical protein LPJ64_001134 [Coemansia asiatica]|uniref:Uncharacterized protein n=1 Tax=Coemansia asiatica TaxID=1052880 RepID=A0A9W7XLU6_9FUNG|nr:hypothetical protein LPJ64_001134 [Coemansia asiatica]
MSLHCRLFTALAVLTTYLIYTSATQNTPPIYSYERHNSITDKINVKSLTNDCASGYTHCEYFGCIQGTQCPSPCSKRKTPNSCIFNINGKGCRWTSNTCIQDIQCPISSSGECPEGCQGCGPFQCIVNGLLCPTPCEKRTRDTCGSEMMVNGIGCVWNNEKCVLWDAVNVELLAGNQAVARQYRGEVSSANSNTGASEQGQTETAGENTDVDEMCDDKESDDEGDDDDEACDDKDDGEKDGNEDDCKEIDDSDDSDSDSDSDKEDNNGKDSKKDDDDDDDDDDSHEDCEDDDQDEDSDDKNDNSKNQQHSLPHPTFGTFVSKPSKSASSDSSKASLAEPTGSTNSPSTSQTLDNESGTKSIGTGALVGIIALVLGIIGLVSWGGLYFATRRKTEYNASSNTQARTLPTYVFSQRSGTSTLNLSYSGPPAGNQAQAQAQAPNIQGRRDTHLSNLMN